MDPFRRYVGDGDGGVSVGRRLRVGEDEISELGNGVAVVGQVEVDQPWFAAVRSPHPPHRLLDEAQLCPQLLGRQLGADEDGGVVEVGGPLRPADRPALVDTAHRLDDDAAMAPQPADRVGEVALTLDVGAGEDDGVGETWRFHSALRSEGGTHAADGDPHGSRVA